MIGETPFYDITYYTDYYGNKTTRLRSNLTFPVLNNKIETGEVINKKSHVYITGLYEIGIQDEITDENHFKCNYSTGTIYLYPTRNNTNLTLTYYAEAQISYRAANITIQDINNNYASNTVEEALKENADRINNLVLDTSNPAEVTDAHLDSVYNVTDSTMKQGLDRRTQIIKQNSDNIGNLQNLNNTNIGDELRNHLQSINGLTTLTKPYNPDKNLIFGQEYLSTFHKKIMNTAPFTVVMSGDSTTENLDIIDKYKIHNILKSLFNINGLPFSTVLNHGHSGQGTYQWSQTYVNDDIAASPSLLILRWGLNDPVGGATISDTEYSLRDGLTKFRTSLPYSQCSILIMTPNTSNDDANGRGQAWHKAINEMYRRVAREFNCCFIDTYELLQDSTSDANIVSEYMDNVSGVHVHPKDVMNMNIAATIFNTIVPKSFNMSSTNIFINDIYTGLLSTNGLPSFFNRGMSIYKADSNFPFPNSPVCTIKSSDDILMQINYSSIKSNYAFRTGKQSSDTWNEWVYIGGSSPKGVLTLLNGWQNFGDPAKTAGYWISSNNEIVLEGVVKLGTVGMAVANLPLAPLANEYFITTTSTGYAKFVAQGDGQLVCLSATDNAWVSLSGIRCRLD